MKQIDLSKNNVPCHHGNRINPSTIMDVLRLDGNSTTDEIKEALEGESRPKIIVIVPRSMEGLKASMVAVMLHKSNLPILAGNVNHVSDEELLKFSEENSIPKPRQEDLMAALLSNEAFKITAHPILEDIYIDVDPKQKKFSDKNNKNRQRHFNRSQKQNFKGKR